MLGSGANRIEPDAWLPMMADADEELISFQDRLGYRFQDASLLNLALTHASCGKPNNQRLEFLGDTVLNLVAADWVYESFEDDAEAELTRQRAAIINNRFLAHVAANIGIAKVVRLSGGYRKGVPSVQQSTLADAFEAIVGAIYLDASLEVARNVVMTHLQLARREADSDSLKHPKNELQEFVIRRFGCYPEYSVEGFQQQPGDPWEIVCSIPDQKLVTRASAKSKLEAETFAASEMLALLANCSD